MSPPTNPVRVTLTHAASYTYDFNDNLTQVTDRESQETGYTYDALDRLSEVTFDDSSTITYTYDAADRITEIDDSANGTITRTYDDLDRLTEETTPQGTITYTYDDDGRRSTMTVDGQTTVSYTYDNAHRLTAITQGSASVAITYDNADRRSTLTFPNGIVTTYGYDNGSRLTSLTYTLGQTTLGNLTHTYDAAGNRTSVGGNWARTGLPAALTSATYDAANRLTDWDSTSFTYDLNGNLTGDGTNSYTWNARNQLTGLSGGVSASFQYDGAGRRRGKTVSSTTTQFLYDGLNLVQELSSGGTPTANLLTGLGIDETFVRTLSGGTETLITDALGSTAALANGSGSVQTEYTYAPFGETSVSGTSSTNAAQFTGRENDGTGLYYFRARYYSPMLQRFVSEDPLDLGANRYAYVGNQPLSWIDPFGLQHQEPPGGPPFPPVPGGEPGIGGWRKTPSGRWVPKAPIPSPTGSQPDASWDTEDGWWRKHPGTGGKTEHYWPDGSPAPDRHPKYPPPPPKKDPADNPPEEPAQRPSFCEENPAICIIGPLLPLIPILFGLPPVPIPVP